LASVGLEEIINESVPVYEYPLSGAAFYVATEDTLYLKKTGYTTYTCKPAGEIELKYYISGPVIFIGDSHQDNYPFVIAHELAHNYHIDAAPQEVKNKINEFVGQLLLGDLCDSNDDMKVYGTFSYSGEYTGWPIIEAFEYFVNKIVAGVPIEEQADIINPFYEEIFGIDL